MKREGDEHDIPLEAEDVVRLVKWKLKHGKFRPNLLKLASSNTSSTIRSTSLSAFAMDTPIASMRTLTLLTGIGPATSSLLLSAHSPDSVLFFSDEVFRWLCRGGKESPIKYSWKEYAELAERGNVVMQRLDVGARDVERVAWVVMRAGTEGLEGKVTAAVVRNERMEGSQRKSGDHKRTSTDRGSPGPESSPTLRLKKSSTAEKEKCFAEHVENTTNLSPDDDGAIVSGISSLKKQVENEKKLASQKAAATAAAIAAARATTRTLRPPKLSLLGNLPSNDAVSRLRIPESPSLRASERSKMAISQQKIIPEDKIMKAFEANARKSTTRPRAKSSKTAAEDRRAREKLDGWMGKGKGGSLDIPIPDAKTLARRASARLQEQQQREGGGSIRKKRTEDEPVKLEAVVEDSKSKGTKLARVIGPPPQTNRKSRETTDVSTQSQAQPESPADNPESPRHSVVRVITPIRQRDGSRFSEALSPQRTHTSPVPKNGTSKRVSSEQKGRSPDPEARTGEGKRSRRSERNAQRGNDAASVATVECSGCLSLGRSGR